MKKFVFLLSVMLSTCVALFAQQPLSDNPQNNAECLVGNINDNELVLSSMPDESAQAPDMKISLDPKLAETYVYCTFKTGSSFWAKYIPDVNVIKGVSYAYLNFGVIDDFNMSKGFVAKDAEGKAVVVKSVTDALNRLVQLGWELAQITPVISTSSDEVSSDSEYLIKKKVKDLLPAEWEYYRKYIML